MAGLAAIQYDKSSFHPRFSKTMGRQVASRTFLEAWLRHSGADPITSWTESEDESQAFAEHVRELRGDAPIASAQPRDITALKSAGALWLGDPSIGRYAWQRRWHGQTSWSIVGIVHTLSTHAAMDRLVEMLRAPIQPWDALICTSTAAKQVVTTIFRAEAEYLRDRMGAQTFSIPNLPVIPLGVDCPALRHDRAARERWRLELGLGPSDVAILQFGRLAYHAKAHPTPLYLALAEAGRRIGKPLHLILAGQFVNKPQEQAYRSLAEQCSAKVVTHFVDGTRTDVDGIRSAADIGTLLSDNIQETFGLAPVEMMAAGLPLVVSDWNGLRDTVEQGVTGFRAKTLIPPSGVGNLLARRYDLFGLLDPFLAGAAQSTLVDVGQTADAFEALARDAGLRRDMGEAGRRRAVSLYDWPVVINSYRTLLTELEIKRRSGANEVVPPRSVANPARMDPFTAFAAYASSSFTENTLLRAAGGGPESVGAAWGGAEDTIMDPPTLPPAAELDRMIAALGREPLSVAALCARFPEDQRGLYVAAVGWLLKYGYAIACLDDDAAGETGRHAIPEPLRVDPKKEGGPGIPGPPSSV